MGTIQVIAVRMCTSHKLKMQEIIGPKSGILPLNLNNS